MRLTALAVVMFTIGVSLSLMLGAQPVTATCTSTNQCPATHVCLPHKVLPGVKECQQQYCNADSECPSARPSCHNGACMSLTSGGGGGGTGGGTGGSAPAGSLGTKCGQVKFGQVTKNLGCQKGLQCVKVPASSPSGTCQKMAQ